LKGHIKGDEVAKKWTHTEAFAHFGTKPRNVQWSWSARSDDGKTVVVTLWQDEISRKEGRLVCERPGTPEHIRRRPGFSELMENFAWAQHHCNGSFKVIIAIAKDKTADPRSIQECFPSKMAMKLLHFDAETGAFLAEAEGS
jgi:hypothetical protein